MDLDLAGLFSLDGKAAVIVGAASGIGRQAAVAFARAGARLTLADIDSEGLDATAALVRPWRDDVDCVAIDVRNREAVQQLGERAAQRWPIDVWANVAGIIDRATVAEMTPEALDRVIDVNLKGVYWGCAAAARLMSPRGRGSIINISSSGADWPSAELSAYAMTKAAVNMLTRSLAHEVGPSGVRVNAVAPGFIETPLVAYHYTAGDGAVDQQLRDQVFAARAAATVLKRIGQPSDVAMAMLYLASDASSFVTGQIIRPNGGMVMP